MRIEAGTKVLVRGELAEVVDTTAEKDLVEVRYVNRGYADRDVSHLVPPSDVKPFEVRNFGLVTIYVRSEFGFGFRKIEASLATLEYRPFAQHARAVHVTFKKRSARSLSSFVRTPFSSEFVILAGWGHQVSRHLSCDPKWTTEFVEKLDDYVTDRRDRALLLVREIGTQ